MTSFFNPLGDPVLPLPQCLDLCCHQKDFFDEFNIQCRAVGVFSAGSSHDIGHGGIYLHDIGR